MSWEGGKGGRVVSCEGETVQGGCERWEGGEAARWKR